ncbi:MAG: 50S ribosomal protein L24 [Chloroflexi bacterium]|nr:50S ribosomal protein L24 [Chloroflexota bacterium]|tara:strand:- start:1966 stop:2286 length:321 start_codon:yes stop_codon:yes gene_type:complete
MIIRIKRDDLVEVIRGRDKGKRGTVQQISSKDSLAFIEGINLVKRHQKATGTTTQQGGIISIEKPLPLFKLMPVCPSCDKATRVTVRVLDDGTKARICKRCDGMFS